MHENQYPVFMVLKGNNQVELVGPDTGSIIAMLLSETVRSTSKRK